MHAASFIEVRALLRVCLRCGCWVSVAFPGGDCVRCVVRGLADIKCANCFMTKSGNLKIGDLNVSKLMKGGLVKTQIGTPYYMSPEIWRNKPYDQKSDMWSVGCVLYELCAQRPPFKGVDIEDLSRHVQVRIGAAVERCVWRGCKWTCVWFAVFVLCRVRRACTLVFRARTLRT